MLKALTLTQPWATLVANGSKRVETRSWEFAYRGPVAIHAAKAFPRWARDFCARPPFLENLKDEATFVHNGVCLEYTGGLPLGAIVALADVVWIRATEDVPRHVLNVEEEAFGDYSAGRFAIGLGNVRRLVAPVPCKGALGLWTVPAAIATRMEVCR